MILEHSISVNLIGYHTPIVYPLLQRLPAGFHIFIYLQSQGGCLDCELLGQITAINFHLCRQSEQVWTLIAHGEWHLLLPASSYCSAGKDMWSPFLYNMWEVLTYGSGFVWQMAFGWGLFHDFIHSALNHMLSPLLMFLVFSGILHFFLICESCSFLKSSCLGILLASPCTQLIVLFFYWPSLLFRFLCLWCSYDV